MKGQIENAKKYVEEEEQFELNTKLSAEIRIQSAKNPAQVQLMGTTISPQSDKDNENKSKTNNSYI